MDGVRPAGISPARWRFSQLFKQCLLFDKSPVRPLKGWKKRAFAEVVKKSPSAVGYWCDGSAAPETEETLESIIRELYADCPGYEEKKQQLRVAWLAIGQEASSAKFASSGPAPTESGDTAMVSSEPVARGIPVNVPRAPRFFLGRGDALDAIHRVLSDRTDHGGSVVLYGLGGVGKTSLAAAYHQRHQKDYRACFWIRAETNEAIIEDLAAIKERYFAEEEGAIDWLARVPVDTLLIYDNAEDARSLRSHLPPTGGARILVTSNDHAWESVGTPIEISTWSRNIGAEFLTARSGQRDALRDVAEMLSDKLGGLPLAHEQAAAYCERRSVSLADYTKRFDGHPIKLLNDERYAPIEHRRSVAKTFSIAIDAATELHSAAGQFILLVSLFGPHDVPRFVFEENYDRLPDPLKTAIQNGELEEVIAALRSFSLLEFEKSRLPGDGNKLSISLHRLVRLVVLETCDPTIRQAAKKSSFDLLSSAISKFEGVSEYTRNYGSNVIEPPMAPRFRAVFPIVRYLVDSEDKDAHRYFIHFYMPMKFGPLYYRHD